MSHKAWLWLLSGPGRAAALRLLYPRDREDLGKLSAVGLAEPLQTLICASTQNRTASLSVWMH